MSDTNHPKPILARSEGSTGAGAASDTQAPASKTGLVIERPPQLDMASARALANRIRAKLKGRPRLEDSTAIIRQFRSA